MRTADFDYYLPPELIAQTPAAERDQSRVLVLRRPDRLISHRRFRDIAQYLRAGEVLVLNDSRVIPARLHGTKAGSGGQIEVLLAEERAANDRGVMLRPGKRVRPGTKILFLNRSRAPTEVNATIIEKNDEGHCRLRFSGTQNIIEALDGLGHVPLPPYISRDTFTV